MRIVHWNIQHGGGPRRTPEIALALLALRADVVVLTEFRRSTGGQIAGVLHDHGLPHQTHTDPPPAKNGVLLASRYPLQVPPTPDDPDIAQRRIDARLLGPDCWITGVHVPDAARSDAHATARKARHFRSLISLARARAADFHAIVGDLNTGRHHLDEPGAVSTCTPLLGQIATLGYRDAYRELHPAGTERSWISHAGRGFRLDHALVSAPLAPTIRALEYAHRERRRKLSDHAPLTLELDTSPDTRGAKTVRA
ncbi:MAG: endonuclease [Phycisphaeraceae bacterium]|nr:MAG: endonuclease [Phycisphaeraceae bacterium]